MKRAQLRGASLRRGGAKILLAFAKRATACRRRAQDGHIEAAEMKLRTFPKRARRGQRPLRARWRAGQAGAGKAPKRWRRTARGAGCGERIGDRGSVLRGRGASRRRPVNGVRRLAHESGPVRRDEPRLQGCKPTRTTRVPRGGCSGRLRVRSDDRGRADGGGCRGCRATARSTLAAAVQSRWLSAAGAPARSQRLWRSQDRQTGGGPGCMRRGSRRPAMLGQI
jgi:hypothetical protein